MIDARIINSVTLTTPVCKPRGKFSLFNAPGRIFPLPTPLAEYFPCLHSWQNIYPAYTPGRIFPLSTFLAEYFPCLHPWYNISHACTPGRIFPLPTSLAQFFPCLHPSHNISHTCTPGLLLPAPLAELSYSGLPIRYFPLDHTRGPVCLIQRTKMAAEVILQLRGRGAHWLGAENGVLKRLT